MGNKPHRLCKSNPKGFTLIEVMIAIAMTGIVMGAIYGIFFSANQTYFTQDAVTDTQQRARIGLDFMVRDIRIAGLDPMGTAVAGIEAATATKIRFTADRNMNGAIENINRERLTYEYDGNRLCLYEGADLGTPPPPATETLIDNVSALSFIYRDVDGIAIVLPVSASNLANIRTVDISITCQGKDYKRKDISRTLQTRISCRNLGM
ncbi:MAG: prepilin-type N-terminal cleavage/methylation domain-containing protein [Deltaproteobacteria bacterium]|nr:prepilin-type N-terminal cleavage/methylation domain-containing protein [Deltaproteobacteria bacterium]